MRVRIGGDQVFELANNESLEHFLDSISDRVGTTLTVIEARKQEKWRVLDWLQSHLERIEMPGWLELEHPDLDTFKQEVRDLLGDWVYVSLPIADPGYSKFLMTEDLDSPTIENSYHVIRYSYWYVPGYFDALMLVKADDGKDYFETPLALCEHYEKARIATQFIEVNAHYYLTINLNAFEEPVLLRKSDVDKVQALGDFIIDHMISDAAAFALCENSSGAFTEKEWRWLTSHSRMSSMTIRGLDEKEVSRLRSILSEHKFAFRLIESLIEDGGPRWLALFVLSIWDSNDMQMEDLFIEFLDHHQAVEHGLGFLEITLKGEGGELKLDSADAIGEMYERAMLLDDFAEKNSLLRFLGDASSVLKAITE